MSNSEVNAIFFWKMPGGHMYTMPCGMNVFNKLWWLLMPGTVINVKWPKGWVILSESPDGSTVSTDSADPNDHYRPWLEKHVGKQGWDWQWGMANTDASENRLTIKIRRKYAEHAIIAALRWS
jgi:hypothetical protein